MDIIRISYNSNNTGFEKMAVLDVYKELQKASDDANVPREAVKTIATDVYETLKDYCERKSRYQDEDCDCSDNQGGSGPTLHACRYPGYKYMMPSPLLIRAAASLDLEEYDDARRDATETLRLLKMNAKCANNDGLFNSVYPNMLQAHDIRSVSYAFTGKLKEAYGDAWVACVLEREYLGGEIEDLAGLPVLLLCMAKTKVKESRPHYSKEETNDFKKMLLIKEYSKPENKCWHCRKRFSTLIRCETCNARQYCSKTCQEDNRRLTHNESKCKEMAMERRIRLRGAGRNEIWFAESRKTLIHEDIVEMGYHLLPDNVSPEVIMFDETTGGFFGSISNMDVVFVADL